MDNNSKTKFSFNSDEIVASFLSVIGVLGLLAGAFIVIMSLFGGNLRETHYATGFCLLFGSVFMLGFSILVKAAIKYLNQGEEKKQ